MSDNHTNETDEAGSEGPLAVSEENPRIYRSTPMKFMIGRFEFKKHILKLTNQKDVDELEAMLDDLGSAADRNKIRTISVDAANKLASSHRAAAVSGSFHSDNALGKDVNALRNQRTKEQLQREGIDPDKIATEPDDNLAVTEVVNQLPAEPTEPATKPAAPSGSLAALVNQGK